MDPHKILSWGDEKENFSNGLSTEERWKGGKIHLYPVEEEEQRGFDIEYSLFYDRSMIIEKKNEKNATIGNFENFPKFQNFQSPKTQILAG